MVVAIVVLSILVVLLIISNVVMWMTVSGMVKTFNEHSDGIKKNTTAIDEIARFVSSSLSLSKRK